MTRNNKFAFALAAVLGCGLAEIPLHAQITSAPIIISKPADTSAPKIRKAEFEVLHMMYTGIQVRSLANPRELHTFTYSEQIRAAMQNLFNSGGYQYGDRVKIEYQSGAEVALHIKGKPSKPKLP